MNRKFLRKLLMAEMELDGFAPPSIIDDGSQIVAFFQENPSVPSFHCIFLDYIMEQMHGPETATVLRKKHSFKGKIIGVTGNVMASVSLLCLYL